MDNRGLSEPAWVKPDRRLPITIIPVYDVLPGSTGITHQVSTVEGIDTFVNLLPSAAGCSALCTSYVVFPYFFVYLLNNSRRLLPQQLH